MNIKEANRIFIGKRREIAREKGLKKWWNSKEEWREWRATIFASERKQELDEQVDYEMLKDTYIRLQKLNLKYKGGQNEELSEIFRKFKKTLCALLKRRQPQESGRDKEGVRESGDTEEIIRWLKEHGAVEVLK